MENKEILEGVENTVKNAAENVAQQVENKKPGFFKRNRWTIIAAAVGTAAGVLIGSKTARDKVVALGNDGLSACKNAFSKKAPVLEEEFESAQPNEQRPNHNKWEGKNKGGWNNNHPKYNNNNFAN
jgi:hypothetical protein